MCRFRSYSRERSAAGGGTLIYGHGHCSVALRARASQWFFRSLVERSARKEGDEFGERENEKTPRGPCMTAQRDLTPFGAEVVDESGATPLHKAAFAGRE